MDYNFFMLTGRTSISNELLTNKVKVVLSKLGMNEKYHSFEYLSYIVVYMLLHDDSTKSYHDACNFLRLRFEIANKSISSGIASLLNNCDNELLKSKTQYKLNNSMLNKIRVIKNYVLNTLSNFHD